MTNEISRTFEVFFFLFFQTFLKILLRTVLNITCKIAGPISHSFSETPRLIIGWRDQLHNTNGMRQINYIDYTAFYQVFAIVFFENCNTEILSCMRQRWNGN